MDILEKLPQIEKAAEGILATCTALYLAWKLHYGKIKQQDKIAAVPPTPGLPKPPESPPAAPPSHPLDPPKTPTISRELMAKIAVLEAEKRERLSVEQTVSRERQIWELEEQIRRLKKERDELIEDSSKDSRELVRLRFEVSNLRDEIEMRDHKIARLKSRLYDSERPKKGNP